MTQEENKDNSEEDDEAVDIFQFVKTLINYTMKKHYMKPTSPHLTLGTLDEFDTQQQFSFDFSQIIFSFS